MQLSKQVQKRLATELDFAVAMMENSEDPREKLFFFSAVFGELSRAMNWSYDPRLALAHLVTQQAHQQINSRVQAFLSGADRFIAPSPGYLDALESTSRRFADLFRDSSIDEKEFLDVLTAMANLAYAATGNGFYLAQKGSLSIGEPDRKE